MHRVATRCARPINMASSLLVVKFWLMYVYIEINFMDQIGIITLVAILIIVILFGSMRQKRIKRIMERFENVLSTSY